FSRGIRVIEDQLYARPQLFCLSKWPVFVSCQMTNLTEDCHGPTKPVRACAFPDRCHRRGHVAVDKHVAKSRAHRGWKLMVNGAAIPAIEVENLWVGYGSVAAGGSVQFGVEEGGALTLPGASRGGERGAGSPARHGSRLG